MFTCIQSRDPASWSRCWRWPGSGAGSHVSRRVSPRCRHVCCESPRVRWGQSPWWGRPPGLRGWRGSPSRCSDTRGGSRSRELRRWCCGSGHVLEICRGSDLIWATSQIAQAFYWSIEERIKLALLLTLNVLWSWKVRQVTEFLFKCCQQLSQIIQFYLEEFTFDIYQFRRRRLTLSVPKVHYQPFDHQSLRIYSTIKYFLAHQIFLCRTVKIFFSSPMDQIFFLAWLSENWADKSWINSQRTTDSNNEILWKSQISFWLLPPDKAESKASEEDERNLLRFSTRTSHPVTPSSIRTRMSL